MINQPKYNQRRIVELLKTVNFPKSQQQIEEILIKHGLRHSEIDFIKLFPFDEVFHSLNDLINRSNELKMLIEQERSMPKEYLKGSQE